MEKADQAGEAVARLLVYQRHAARPRRIELARDIVGLEAHMMEPAAAAREELADAALGGQRLEQLDLAIAYLEQRGAHALLLDGRAFGQCESQHVAPQAQPVLEPRH